MKKTAAAYIRVSSDRQDEFSPDSQLKLIREYCDRYDIDLPDELVFYDDGISAKSAKKRQQFNDMIALAKQKEKPFQLILVWKFSRFARNQEESIVYKSLLRRNGVEVVSISEPIQDNPFGGLIERIIEWMDEYYLIRLSDEVRRGMTERATRGLSNTAPPYGYHKQNGEDVVIPEEAAIVLEIHQRFHAIKKKLPIVRWLESIGAKTHFGNKIDLRMVEYILCNPFYIGMNRWNPNGPSASKRMFNNPSDILVKGPHQPIVPEDLFWANRNYIIDFKERNGKHAREGGVNEYMLRGIVKCSACGATLVYSKANGGLQCHQYSKGTCGSSHFVLIKKIDQMVIDAMEEAVRTGNFNVDAGASTTAAEDASSVNYDALISAERTKLERAKQAYQAGVDSLAEYRVAKEQIEKRIARLQEERTRNATPAGDIDVEAFKDAVGQVLAVLKNPGATEELKSHAIRTVVQRVIFDRANTKVEVIFHL